MAACRGYTLTGTSHSLCDWQTSPVRTLHCVSLSSCSVVTFVSTNWLSLSLCRFSPFFIHASTLIHSQARKPLCSAVVQLKIQNWGKCVCVCVCLYWINIAIVGIDLMNAAYWAPINRCRQQSTNKFCVCRQWTSRSLSSTQFLLPFLCWFTPDQSQKAPCQTRVHHATACGQLINSRSQQQQQSAYPRHSVHYQQQKIQQQQKYQHQHPNTWARWQCMWTLVFGNSTASNAPQHSRALWLSTFWLVNFFLALSDQHFADRAPVSTVCFLHSLPAIATCQTKPPTTVAIVLLFTDTSFLCKVALILTLYW